MTATVFGKPLRDPSWHSLSVRQRLIRELDRWLSIHPPAIRSLLIFWHSARKYSLATLAQADCQGHLALCLNVQNYRDARHQFSAVFYCCSLVAARLIEDRPDFGYDMVPIPVDFRAFDKDPESISLTPPPLIGEIAGTYTLTLGALLKTPRGPTCMAMGWCSPPSTWVDWFIQEGHDLYRSERFITATFMPPQDVEATLLDHGLNMHRVTGLIPTFSPSIPWEIPADSPSFDIQVQFISGLTTVLIYSLSLMYYDDIEKRAQRLRCLIDDAVKLITVGSFSSVARDTWDRKRQEWEDDLKEAILKLQAALGVSNRIGTAKLTIYVLSVVPNPGAWIPDTGKLADEMERFSEDSASRVLREGPFLVVKLNY